MDPLVVTSSVGDNGTNDAADVERVQKRFNAISAPEGGPSSGEPLAVTGVADQELVDLITAFQGFWGLPAVDGRIDPGGATLARINLVTGDICGPVNAFDFSLGVAVAAQEELNDWRSNGWTDKAGSGGVPRVESYWSAVSGSFDAEVNGLTGAAKPWSAVFISYVHALGYVLQGGLGDVGGAGNFFSLPEVDRRRIINQARRCIQSQRMFAPRGAHVAYVRATLGLNNDTDTAAAVEDVATRVLDIGDLVLYGRSGNRYAAQGGRLVRVSGTGDLFSHVDVVVDLNQTIEGVPVATLIGGNTLPGAEKVGMKHRPLAGGALAAGSPIPAPVQDGIDAGRLTQVGASGYYRISGRDDYEVLQLGDTDVVMTLM